MQRALLACFLLALARATYSQEVGSVICPDGQSECPDYNTCCRLSSGKWGCCPLPKAVCCSDHAHCCPQGYTCNVAASTCVKGELTVPWSEKNIATPVQAENVVCPDGQSQCPTGNTCCKLSSGEWGCCPFFKAVCCSDHVHCCRHGYTCGQGTCNKGDLTVPWQEKTVAKPVQAVNVICPDGQSHCPTGTTCCKMASGGYGCCPFTKAVCCSDLTHCCPQGYTCDVSHGTCTKEELTVPWQEKSIAEPVQELGNVGIVCPNSTSICQHGQTCCRLSKTTWGCCPEPSAVCCKDMKHCCPHGTKCTASGACVGASGTTPWLTKTEAKEMAPKETTPWFTKTLARTYGIDSTDVECDETYKCPDGNTCCRLASGQWGCCPLSKAVCCSDGIHCCPSGHTCDVAKGTCVAQMEAVTWSFKTGALAAFVGTVSCNATAFCPDGNTCCKLVSGEWGCCPYPKAVCCSDHEHCCPQNTTCDLAQGKCNPKTQEVKWSTETLARSVGAQAVKCDSTYYCPDGSTCCKLSTGQWGCCPLPSAVCCSDHLHCCPNGYKCNAATGSCEK